MVQDFLGVQLFVRKKGLSGGYNRYRVHQVKGALRHRVEAADAFHLVAKELDPGRQVAAGGIDVEDATAPAEAPRRLHHVFPLIAHVLPSGEQPIEIDRHPLPDDMESGKEIGWGESLLRQSVGRDDNQRRSILAIYPFQHGEGLDSLLNCGRVGGEALIGQGIRLGENVNRGVAAPGEKLLLELLRLLWLCRHHQHRLAQFPVETGDKVGSGGIEHHQPLHPAFL